MILLSVGLAQKFRFLENEKKTALVAAEANQHYQLLVKVLSHDIANIVTSCRQHFANVVAADLPSNIAKSVTKIRENGERLQTVLRSVREEIILKTVSQNLELSPVNVLKAWQEALQSCSWEIQEKELRIEIEVPEYLTIWVHREAFVNQVLINLISNSVKFSQSGTILHISAEELNESVVVSLADQGVGLTPSQKVRIFQDEIPFSARVHQNKEGSGLGSTLIAAYMKLFWGTIEVESKHESEGPDHGTTVRLFFPKHQKI